MAGTSIKKTVKNETISPYALASENPWIRIAYRFDEAEVWQNALVAPFIVLPSNREDVRTDVLHSFDIEVDVSSVIADGIPATDVDLIVLARDSFGKNIVKFLQKPLNEGPKTVLNVRRDVLESTSMSARIDFQIMLVARTKLPHRGRTIRRGGRLAAHTVSVSSEKKGHTFHFSKTSSAEFVQRDLPGFTTFYLDVTEPDAVIGPCDDVSAVLSVLVHEDAWSTLQEIRSGDRVGEALGAIFLSDVVFSVLLVAGEALRDNTQDLDDSSVASRLLAWISEKSKVALGDLEKLLTDEDGVLKIYALVQDTLRSTHAIHRVRIGEEEQA